MHWLKSNFIERKYEYLYKKITSGILLLVLLLQRSVAHALNLIVLQHMQWNPNRVQNKAMKSLWPRAGYTAAHAPCILQPSQKIKKSLMPWLNSFQLGQ
jgi:hypothetical protein